MRARKWIDRGRFKIFDGVPLLPEYLAPLDVVLNKHDPQGEFFGVPTSDEDREWLRSLGALNQPDDEECIGRVAEVLQGLQERIPEPADLPASVGLSLRDLFNRLMSRLAEDDENIPTLVERNGHLEWFERGTEAWVARREERQELRRFFPDLALVAAEHRGGLPEKLGLPTVLLHKRVLPDVDRRSTTCRSSSIRERITPHLAVLAAVADQSRQAMPTLSAERLQRAWRLQQPVIEVPDAWVEVGVEGPTREPIAWRKNKYDDVFHLSTGKDDPGVVIFDVDPASRDDENWKLPLRDFGDALAKLLVNNAALGPVFSQVLASIDEECIDDYVVRNHLDDLVREWSERLRPLSDDERKELEGLISKVCVNPSRVLSAGRIRAEDIQKRSDITFSGVQELEAWLNRKAPKELAPYLPALVVASDNQLAWEKWLGQRRQSLAALVDTLGGFPTNWQQDLQDRARKFWDSLKFEAAGIAADYLREFGHEISDLDQQLDEIAPTFSDVQTAPLPPSQIGWRARKGCSGAGQGGPHRTLTQEDLLEEGIARGAIGDAAEQALLSWVVEQVQALRNEEGFKKALLSAFKPNSKTWQSVDKALNSGDLRNALHIASRWSGAGFDLLGLERTEAGQLAPVRYECKGISARTPRILVHLSRNELGVARRVRREGPGKWLLVGVQPDGKCVDLTDLLADLLHQDEAPLKPLYDRGLEPDGLRLVIERTDITDQ